MKISIIGAGYVGLAIGMGFVKLGNQVVFVDVDQKKVELINNAIPPLYEKGLSEAMREFKGKYYATESYLDAITNTGVSFITVSTPSKSDGSIDLKYLEEAATKIGENLKEKNRYHVVIVKSTVLPGTTEGIVKQILEECSGRKAFEDFGLAMCPEFLREGNALDDFLNPDRIVIGVNDDKTRKVLEELYSAIKAPKIVVDIKTAEMIKYTANAFLAAKISFANEIGNLCKKLGIDSWKVFEGVGLDHRISPHFFRTGIGWGGSCFPKDLRALIYKYEKELGERPLILNAVLEVNEKQPLKMIELLKKHVPEISGKRIAILGLTFKPHTDDVRESRAYVVIKKLVEEGAKIIAYDPKGIENFKHIYPEISEKIEFIESCRDALERVEIVLITTEWPEFEELDYSGKIVIDGRRIKKAEKSAKIYEGVCW